MRMGLRCGVLSLVAAAMLGTSVMAAGLDNFHESDVSEPFTDVSDTAWYSDDVETAYQLGLVKGSGDTTFNPSGTLSLAEGIALACRLHDIYNGGDGVFEQSDVWYQVYLDYANANGIFTDFYNWNYQRDYTAPATRAQFAMIFASALPDEGLESINKMTLGDVPDVWIDATYYKDVYKLYAAGVLTGNDELRTFAPGTQIDRASVATIVTRMAKPEMRKSLTIDRPVNLKCDEEITLESFDETSVFDHISYDKYEKESYESISWGGSHEMRPGLDVHWSSSDKSLVWVDDENIIRGASRGGDAVLTITVGNESAKMKVHVNKAEHAYLYWETDYMELEVGDSDYVEYGCEPSDFELENIGFKSSDTSVAKVSRTGKVTAVGEGEAEISMWADGCGQIDDLWIWVYNGGQYEEPEMVESVSFDRSSITLEVGDSQYLDYDYEPGDAEIDYQDFTSSDSSVASVTSSGWVTAKSEGRAEITVELDGVQDTMWVYVEGNEEPEEPEVTEPDMSGIPDNGIEWNTNYGPATLNQYLSGGTKMGSVQVDTFKFVDVEYVSIDKYKVTFQYNATAEDEAQYFYLNLIDEDGVMFEDLIIDATDSDGSTIEDYTYWEPEIYERIAEVVLVSATGHADGETEEEPSRPDTSKPDSGKKPGSGGASSYVAYEDYPDVPDYGALFYYWDLGESRTDSGYNYMYSPRIEFVTTGHHSERDTYRENGLSYIAILEELGFTQVSVSSEFGGMEHYRYDKGSRSVYVNIPEADNTGTLMHVLVGVYRNDDDTLSEPDTTETPDTTEIPDTPEIVGCDPYAAYEGFTDVPDYGALFDSNDTREDYKKGQKGYFYDAMYRSSAGHGNPHDDWSTYRENGLSYIEILKELGYTETGLVTLLNVDTYSFEKDGRKLTVGIPVEESTESAIFVAVVIDY